MSENEIEISKGSAIRALIPAGQRGVELRSLDDFYRFSQYVFAANMVPNGITNVEGVLIAIQRGAEVGLLPMQALQSIYIVNRQPHLFGDAPKAIVEASGLMEDCKEYEEGKFPEDSYKWICKVKRRGRDWRVSEFSIADAKIAKIWAKENWTFYPKRMLLFRARGYALRDEFSDVLKGFPIRELSDDDDAAFARAKPLVGAVVEPKFSDAKESQAEAAGDGKPAAEPSSQKRPRGRPPKATQPELMTLAQAMDDPAKFVAGMTEQKREQHPFSGLVPPKQAEPEAQPKAMVSEPLPAVLAQVREKLRSAHFDERDFLLLLQFARMLGKDIEPEQIKLGTYVLEDASEQSLKDALEDWENVQLAIGQRIWEKKP